MSKFNILFFICISLSSCKLFSTSEKITDNEPISILWTNTGGAIPKNESIFLSKDSCSLLLKNLDYKNIILFSLTDNQLNDIFSILKTNQFEKIETYNRDVFDRGGTKITLNNSNDTILVSNASMSFVKDKFLDNYKAIENKILEITYAEVNKQKVNVKINLDKSITDLKGDILVFINNKEYYNEKNDGEFLEFDLDLFLNQNKFKIYVMKFGSTYNTVEKKFDTTLKVLPQSQNITLSVKNDKLIVE